MRPSRVVDEVKEDPPDNRIIECALAAASEYIVTGDKDLLRRKRFENIKIVPPADFLQFAHGLEKQ